MYIDETARALKVDKDNQLDRRHFALQSHLIGETAASGGQKRPSWYVRVKSAFPALD